MACSSYCWPPDGAIDSRLRRGKCECGENSAPSAPPVWPEAVLQAEVLHLLQTLVDVKLLHLNPRTSGKLLETVLLVHTFQRTETRDVMDKLKKVLSGQEDGNTDGTGILEVTLIELCAAVVSLLASNTKQSLTPFYYLTKR